ncbi:hypothetical protein ABZP36_035268 [Zizania latifolia]
MLAIFKLCLQTRYAPTAYAIQYTYLVGHRAQGKLHFGILLLPTEPCHVCDVSIQLIDSSTMVVIFLVMQPSRSSSIDMVFYVLYPLLHDPVLLSSVNSTILHLLYTLQLVYVHYVQWAWFFQPKLWLALCNDFSPR